MYKEIKSDLVAHLEGRVTISSVMKTLLFKLSFQTVLLYRVSHACRKTKILIPVSLFLDYFSTVLSSCYISSRAIVGPGLNLPHATGIVIGEGAVIGSNCTIYQSVTLGRKSHDKADYPSVGNGVIIYSGSVLLGNIAIGSDSVIGSNSTVLESIDSNSVAVGSPARVLGGS